MTLYIYTGAYTTVYTHQTDADGKPLIAVPGVTYNLDGAPDSFWKAASTKKAAAETPVTTEPETTTTQTESEPQ